MLKSFAAYAAVVAVAIIASVAIAQTEEQPVYLDDRSTPVQLVLSYFNAIDRGEYARAHGYFGPEDAPGYDGWQFHFDDVVTTEVSFGQMAQEGAAGSIYYQLPVTVDFEHAEGDHHVERGCINMRWISPANQERPPFQPMYIISADLETASEAPSFAPAKCDSAPKPTAGSPAYLDDRSTPEQSIRSYFNALQSGEYGRAVSYFAASSAPKDYAAWWQSQESMSRVNLRFGMPSHYSTAGYISYNVPVVVEAEYNGTSWVDVGCIGAYWEMPLDETPFKAMTIGPIDLKRQATGEPAVPPPCDD
jgi:hypothetical protein